MTSQGTWKQQEQQQQEHPAAMTSRPEALLLLALRESHSVSGFLTDRSPLTVVCYCSSLCVGFSVRRAEVQCHSHSPAGCHTSQLLGAPAQPGSRRRTARSVQCPGLSARGHAHTVLWTGMAEEGMCWNIVSGDNHKRHLLLKA